VNNPQKPVFLTLTSRVPRREQLGQEVPRHPNNPPIP